MSDHYSSVIKMCLLLASCCLCGAASAAAQPSSSSNRAMLQCAELYETLTESAQKLDDKSYESLQKQVHGLSQQCAGALSAPQRKRLETESRETSAAWLAKDRDALALHAVEMYRIMVERADHGSVPREVALMDYAGFRLTALAKQPVINWTAVAQTANEANGWWLAIRPAMQDRNLRAAVNHTISGWRSAVRDHNDSLLRYASTLDLILVDGLEVHFARKTARK